VLEVVLALLLSAVVALMQHQILAVVEVAQTIKTHIMIHLSKEAMVVLELLL
jgi:hypothetical protein